LLSEGDAGTLGKYNAHYSHDIIAHLIGEPIQGNCYMWSAPKQPFVLPVRIRDFELLYKNNIVNNKNEPTYNNSPALSILQKSQERVRILSEALKAKIISSKQTLTTKNFDDNFFGIFGNQLFFFIKEIKEKCPEELKDENQLKVLLLKQILECEIEIRKAVHPKTNKEEDFYCAPEENWKKALQSK
jgi:hypothetical protein